MRSWKTARSPMRTDSSSAGDLAWRSLYHDRPIGRPIHGLLVSKKGSYQVRKMMKVTVVGLGYVGTMTAVDAAPRAMTHRKLLSTPPRSTMALLGGSQGASAAAAVPRRRPAGRRPGFSVAGHVLCAAVQARRSAGPQKRCPRGAPIGAKKPRACVVSACDAHLVVAGPACDDVVPVGPVQHASPEAHPAWAREALGAASPDLLLSLLIFDAPLVRAGRTDKSLGVPHVPAHGHRRPCLGSLADEFVRHRIPTQPWPVVAAARSGT